MLEQHGSTRSSQLAGLARLARQSRTYRVVSSRDEPSGIWAYLCHSVIYDILFTTRPPYLFDVILSLLMVTTHAHHLFSLLSNYLHHLQSLIALSDMLHLIFGISFHITQNSSSKLFIPLSATFIWTRWSYLLHTAITFHHFFTILLGVFSLKLIC